MGGVSIPGGPVFRLFALAAISTTLAAQPVKVEIFEKLTAAQCLAPPADATPVDTYQEPAFAFVRIPTKFSGNALPMDRSTPFGLRATYERAFAAGEYRFRLRARGAARLEIDGQVVAESKPQPPNVTGDDPVPPPPVRIEAPLRPASYPHQDILYKVTLAAGTHKFVLTAAIGGKGLYPSPGELAVSISANGQLDRLLGPLNAPHLTDEAWERYVAQIHQKHDGADIVRRRLASTAVAAEWKARHDKIRAGLKPLPAPPQTTLAAYNTIDRFIGARLEAETMPPTALTTDLEFLRRLSLDATGVIPTPAEIRAYLADPPKARRAKAIERVLASTGWADHWVAYWQDVLAENPGILKPDLNNTGPFRWWIHQSFADGIPFDRFVAELLSMEGSAYQGGPAGFAQATLNDAPMAAKAEIVAQAFLGQRMGCARCHDAPFHPFKQKDLFSLAAMMQGKELKLPKTSTVPMKEGGRKPNVVVALQPGQAIGPEWPFATLITHSETGQLPNQASIPSRNEVAALIISPDNDRFPQVIVNRIWKRYMGLGMMEPADDWSRGKPSHPELLAYLSREFVMSGYDTKHVARLIFSSHAYQRKPVADPAIATGAKGRLFSGPIRRNMTAEQLVDSLHRGTGRAYECEDMNLNPSGDRAPNQFLNLGKPQRAWQMTALSNERDRPALALPIAQSIVDVMSAYGWRQSRQNAATSRDDAPSPMQTLILANGILGTRMVRLSDDSELTELALADQPLKQMINEMFVRILSRPPNAEELKVMTSLLGDSYAQRKVKGAQKADARIQSDNRVSWSNHLSAEATVIRMEEERALRAGAKPTARLEPRFRERLEDALWAMVNSPEFIMVP
jgi:hypothetical protein